MEHPASPGLYFLSGRSPGGAGTAPLTEIGPFRAAAVGRLASRAHAGGWTLLFDGVLTHGRRAGQRDAETALDAFLEAGGAEGGGLEALHALEGFYNAILIGERERRAHVFSDPLSSRAWYLYERGGVVAAAPTPIAFARWGLPMRLDRLELFHTFRFLHASLDGTLVEEITRVLPGTRYTLADAPPLRTHRYQAFDHAPDASVTLDESAERVKSFFAEVMRGLLTHPLLAELPVHLPLTAGLDSRHILGELLAQERPPAALRHIRHKTPDYRPVRLMAEDLGLPLLDPSVEDLDWPRLLHRWAARSGGLVNAHQSYLLEMSGHLPAGGALAFNGWLMDWLMAIRPRKTLPAGTTDAARHVQKDYYTRGGMMRLLLPDAAQLAEESLDRLRAFGHRFDGPLWYRVVMLSVYHRGIHYTGPMDPMFADDAFFFSPGAHAQSLDFLRTMPREVAGNWRARLEAMRRHFPALAAYPNADGHPYNTYTALKKSASSRWQYVRPWTEALLSGMQKDPAPESEHAWLRHIAPLRRVHHAVVERSRLVRHGHLRGLGVQASWGLLRLGGYQAWTLMSLLTAEVAYRTLVCHEPPRAVINDLFAAGRERAAR